MKKQLFKHIKETELNHKNSNEWWVNAELSVQLFNETHGTSFDPLDSVIEYLEQEQVNG